MEHHLIIDATDKQEITVSVEKAKELEINLRKLFEINEKLQAKKKPWQEKSDIGHVIRRRKGEPDKRIPQKSNNRQYGIRPGASGSIPSSIKSSKLFL